MEASPDDVMFGEVPAAADDPGTRALVVQSDEQVAVATKRRRINFNREPSPEIIDTYGDLDPAQCTVSGPGIAGGFVGRLTKVNVTARDCDKHRIREGGESFCLSIQNMSDKSAQEIAAQDNADGTYAFTFRVEKKGMYMVRFHADLARHGHSYVSSRTGSHACSVLTPTNAKTQALVPCVTCCETEVTAQHKGLLCTALRLQWHITLVSHC